MWAESEIPYSEIKCHFAKEIKKAEKVLLSDVQNIGQSLVKNIFANCS